MLKFIFLVERQTMYNKQSIYSFKKVTYLCVLLSALMLNNNITHASDTLTLSDVIPLGLKNNYDISLQRLDTQKSTNNLILGTGYLLPKVDARASSNYSWTNDYRSTSVSGSQGQNGGDYQTSAISAEINANWTLFDGFRMFRGKKLLHTYAELGTEQLRVEVENATVKIIQSFFNVVLQQHMVGLAQKQLTFSHQRLEREKSRSDLGRAKKREFLNAKVIVNNDQSNLKKQNLLLKQAKNNLNVLLGRKPDEKIILPSRIELPEYNYTHAEINKLTFERNSTVKLLKLRLKTSELNLKVKKAALSPLLIASGSYRYSARSNDYRNYKTESANGVPSIGLALQWNLINGFSKNVGIRNAQLDLEKSELEKAKYTLQLEALIQQKWDNLEYSYKQVEFEREALDLAQQNIDISNDLFALGSLTGVAFREAQLLYQNAAVRYQNSIVKARISLAELEQLAGVIRIE